jgi:macrolide transport system ATP-binding/permease protein
MKLFSRLRTQFRKKELDRELSEELAFHIEQETEENIAAGMSAEEARYAALRKFGGMEQVKEECRDAWGLRFIETLLQDIRFGARMLIKDPTLTAVVVLTLALGIGVNTSMFSVVYSLALRPLPVTDSARVVGVYEEFHGHYSRGVYGQPNLLSYPEYVRYRDGSHVFSGLAGYADVSLSLGGGGGQSIAGLLASCNYFAVLDGEMTRGRSLSLQDCRDPDAGSVAVISSGFWKSHFGGDPDALGKTLTLNRHVVTVVGITANNFGGTELQVPDVWLPLTLAPQMLPNDFQNPNWLALGDVGWLNVIGRLKRGISHRRAEVELGVLAHQEDANYPGRQTSVTVNSGAYWDSPEMRRVGSWVATAILALAGFILVIACINVMNLPLARATTRQPELGIRLSLGASRFRLIRQLLTETMMVALLGGVASVIVAQWLPPLLVHGFPEMPVSPYVKLTPDFVILTYAFLATLLAAVVCGFPPTLQGIKLQLASALKEKGNRASHGIGRARLRSLLIVAQISGCTVLLVAAGSLVRGLERAEATNPGFNTRNVLVVSLDLANQGYDEARADAFERELHNRLAAVPGVAGVARSEVIPWVSGFTTGVTIPGSDRDSVSQPVWGNVVSPDYFQTMGIHLLRGQTFTEEEIQAHDGVPAIISAAMARRFWGDADPLGREFLSGKTAFQVVGIAPDVQNSHLGETDGPFFYSASESNGALDAKLFVRTNGDTSVVAALVPQLARQLDGNVITSTETLRQALETTLAPSKTLAVLVAVLGLLSMVLAVTGVWGIVAYAASQRRHEIGIRKALGAHKRDILTLLLSQGTTLATIGTAIGLALGAGASQVLFGAGLLFGLSSFDPAVYLMTGCAFFSVTLLACYLPARRATKVDPMVALRCE